jgi:hypothetical protein
LVKESIKECKASAYAIKALKKKVSFKEGAFKQSLIITFLRNHQAAVVDKNSKGRLEISLGNISTSFSFLTDCMISSLGMISSRKS